MELIPTHLILGHSLTFLFCLMDSYGNVGGPLQLFLIVMPINIQWFVQFSMKIKRIYSLMSDKWSKIQYKNGFLQQLRNYTSVRNKIIRIQFSFILASNIVYKMKLWNRKYKNSWSRAHWVLEKAKNNQSNRLIYWPIFTLKFD